MRKTLHILFLIIGQILISCNHKESTNEADVLNTNNCHELPDFIIEKKDQITDSSLVINCYLDNNLIHQFMDGEVKVNIIPYMTNETNKRKLYVDKKTLVGFDTVKLNKTENNRIFYSIKFPSPKGGDVTITKGIELK